MINLCALKFWLWGGYSLFAIFVFLRGAANLRSVPGGKHSSYVTDVYAIKNIFIESS